MKDTDRLIFRSEALRRYTQERERSVLPRIVSPSIFIYLWILFGLLMTGGVIVWRTEVPVYASGQAAIVHGKDGGLLVATFLPPEDHSRLRVGQTMFLNFQNKRLSTSIIAIEPETSSPEAVQKRFSLSAGAALAVLQPATVAMAPLPVVPSGLPASTYVGSVYPAEVAVGLRPVIAFLPLIGQLTGNTHD
jgi:hypothetical protein